MTNIEIIIGFTIGIDIIYESAIPTSDCKGNNYLFDWRDGISYLVIDDKATVHRLLSYPWAGLHALHDSR